LADRGVSNPRLEPQLELYDAHGDQLAANDDWESEQKEEIMATTIPPTDPREAAIVVGLAPGPYTAIVRGKNNTTGIAAVEAYVLQQ
jgi:hypothetical protein